MIRNSETRRGGLALELARRYPARTLWITLMLTLSGAAEAIGLATLLPLLDQLGPGGAADSVIGRLVERTGLRDNVALTVSVIVGAMSLHAFLRWAALLQVGHAVSGYARQLRADLIEALSVARWRFFVDARAGVVANAIAFESTRASLAYTRSCMLLSALLRTAALTLVALLVSWQIAVFALVVGALVSLLLRSLTAMSRRAGESLTAAMRTLGSQSVDLVRGMKPLRAMGRVDAVRPELHQANAQVAAAEIAQLRSVESMNAIRETLVTILIAGGFLYGALVLGRPFPELLASAVLFHRILRTLQVAQAEYQGVLWAESGYRAVHELLASLRSDEAPLTGTRAAPPLEQSIELEHVSFGYAPDALVLHGVSLNIPAGALVVITGASGSGKTTVLDLLSRLNEPTSGRITADGIDLHDISATSWQARIGYVPQDPQLLHASVRANVASGTRATDDEIRRVLEQSGAWNFVNELPHGMDTVLGEQALRISGGQRRRIAIARALIGSPRLLILDEPTSDLDVATEREICATLSALRGSVTVVASSHRSALEQIADAVYDLADGVAAERTPA